MYKDTAADADYIASKNTTAPAPGSFDKENTTSPLKVKCKLCNRKYPIRQTEVRDKDGNLICHKCYWRDNMNIRRMIRGR